MRRKALIIIFVLIFAAGLAIFLYPNFENLLYDINTAGEQKRFFENAANNPELNAALESLYNRLREYNTELYENKQEKLADPFSYSQPNFDLSAYGIGNNCVGYISIEKLNVTLPVLLGANEENMRNGAVHLTETSFPIGGENTNSVIAAHRGVTRIMFRNIHLLEEGDRVIIKNFRETLTYEVCEIKIIFPTDVNELLIQEGRDLVTLLSCHPLGENYQRYVVFCERADTSV